MGYHAGLDRGQPMILEVRIKAPPGGTSRTLQFAKSPVRIGRNQLNDISLDDPFVSEWHGTIRFDERSIAYFDLGSTNGSLLDGKRLAKNVASELSVTSVLRVGLIEMEVSRQAVGTEAPAQRPVSGPHRTLAWGHSAVAPASAGKPAPADSSTSIPIFLATTPPGSASVDPREGTATPPPGARADWRGASPGQVAPSAESQRTSPDRGEGTQAAMARHQAKLLEAFSEAFVGLRKGYEQFGAEVGVRTISGATPLHRARNAKEVLEYLMQPSQDLNAITRDLIAIFADFGIHHIAMMQGVTEGVRNMLQSLSPEATGIDIGGGLFSGGKAKNAWKSYVERFEQMITDDNELHAAIFGNEFARAYARVTQGDAAKLSGDSD
jgi:type VI secretion system protein ImpI